MAKKRNKNKNHIEAKSENKVLHGLAGSLEEAFSEDVSEIEQDEVIVVDVPERKHKGIAKKVAYFLVGLLVVIFAAVGIVNTVIAAKRCDKPNSKSDRPQGRVCALSLSYSSDRPAQL